MRIDYSEQALGGWAVAGGGLTASMDSMVVGFVVKPARRPRGLAGPFFWEPPEEPLRGLAGPSLAVLYCAIELQMTNDRRRFVLLRALYPKSQLSKSFGKDPFDDETYLKKSFCAKMMY